jgi:putative MATE family efflux protein
MPEVGTTPTVAVETTKTIQMQGVDPYASIPTQVWGLAKWPLFEQFMAFFVGFVDTALAGHLKGDEANALNAIGPAAYVTWLMGLLQGAIGVGALAVIARAVGARHRREANLAIGQAILMSSVWGFAITGLIFGLAHPIGAELNLSSEALPLYDNYMYITATVAPFMAILFCGGACLRGAGDFQSPFRVMLIVNIINVIASVALTHEASPIGGMGMRGIAWGTAIAWTVGGILMLRHLLHGRGGIRLHMHRLKPAWPMIKRILRISIPNVTESFFFWVANFIVLKFISELVNEPNAMGAHIAAIRIEALSFLPGFAFGQAASTMVGQYLGAGSTAKARHSAWVCLGFGAAFMTLLGILFVIIPDLFVLRITEKADIVETSAQLLRIIGFAQVGFAGAMVLSGALRGAGDTKMTMYINFGSQYLVRLPLVWLVGIHWEMGLTGIWIVLGGELTFRGLLFLWRFMQGGWMHIKV